MSVPHLLVDRDGIVVVDTGFPGDDRRIRKSITRLGAGPEDVRAILLTHGHLDHAGGAAALRDWCKAPIYAHPAEQAHIDGVFPYIGASRVCGVLEAAGRAVTNYRPVQIDRFLADGDELPLWGGLRVVHLPGHTIGHCGFYSGRRGILLSGDLWARVMMRTQVSPRIFTDAPEMLRSSFKKAFSLGAQWVIPGHYDATDATRLQRRFEKLCERVLKPQRPMV